MRKHGFLKKRNLVLAINTGLCALTLTVCPVQTNIVHAADWGGIGDIIGQVAQMGAEAAEVRDKLLAFGENVTVQNKVLKDSVNKNGTDPDPDHNQRVSLVMNQLINKGNYALRPNSLPFRWRVINNNDWNASCYYNDYVEVNSGIVADLTDDNMLAAVLAHEMTHGLHQHIANDAEKQVYYAYGTELLTKDANWVNDKLLNFLGNYMTTKNTTNTSEADADEFGFYLLASAGFNPGGFPAMVLHMENVDHSSSDFFTEFFVSPSNHPATKTRFERAEKRMEEYGYDHVKVKNGKDVYIDDKLLLTASATDAAQDWENAYLIAGGLSKAFHDNKTSISWDFTSDDFLSDDAAYHELRQEVKAQNLIAQLGDMVSKAYSSDMSSSTKSDLINAENERNQKINEEKAEYKKKEYSREYSDHANDYNNLGLAKLALQETKKALAANDTNYQAYGQLARIYHLENVKYMNNHDGEQSDELLRKAQEANLKALSLAGQKDNVMWIHANLSAVADRLGETDLAKEQAVIVIKSGVKTNGDVYNVLAHSYYTVGDTQNAVKWYKVGVKYNPDVCAVPEDLKAQVFTEASNNSSSIASDDE